MPSQSTLINDDRMVANCYVELAYITKEKGEYDQSLLYHQKSMELFRRVNDSRSIADGHLNMAEIYKAKGKLKQAMSEYEKGLTLYEVAFIDDSNKNIDHGIDVSFNSSSVADGQNVNTSSISYDTQLNSPSMTDDRSISRRSSLTEWCDSSDESSSIVNYPHRTSINCMSNQSSSSSSYYDDSCQQMPVHDPMVNRHTVRLHSFLVVIRTFSP
jgi:tetratricopeptide (TPR) repeat protein